MFVEFSSFDIYGHHILSYLLLFPILLFISVLTYNSCIVCFDYRILCIILLM